MGIILAVTRIAISRKGNLGDIPGYMARLASDASVRSGEREPRLRVVVKAPPRPAVGVVTERTIGPQAPVMMLVPMTIGTNQRRALELQRSMAFLARHDGMVSDQWESREVVIEGRYPAPTGLAVALFAAAAKLTTVAIVLPVARNASRCQLVAI